MNKNIYLLGILLVLLYLALSVSTIDTTGLVWDETRYLAASKVRMHSIYSWATGNPPMEMCTIDHVPEGDGWGRCWHNRPRLAQTISGFTWAITFFLNGQQLDFWSSVAAHRIAIMLLVAIGVFVLFLFTSEAYSIRAGTFASLSLIFMPRFFSHSHYMTLDVTAAIMMLIASYFFWKGLRDWRFGLLTGVMMGLALASKIQAYILFVAIPLWLLISYRDRLVPAARKIKHSNMVAALRRVPLVAYSSIMLTPLVLIAAWPWLWKDTVPRLLDYFGFYSNQSANIHVPVYYLGQIFQSPPWHYPWVMSSVTMPAAILILALAGTYFGLKNTVSLKDRAFMLPFLCAFLLLAFFSTPFGDPHDVVRLFVPIFPFVAMISGIGADRIISLLSDKYGHKIHIAAILAAIIAASAVIPLAGGMPNMVSYYSEIVGGTGGAYAAGFELDYWGESYLHLVPWMNSNLEEKAVVHVPMAWNIFNAYKHGDIGQIGERVPSSDLDSRGLNLAIFDQEGILRNDIIISTEKEGADYYVILNRRSIVDSSSTSEPYNAVEMASYMEGCEPLYSVAAGGVPVSMIFRTDCLEGD